MLLIRIVRGGPPRWSLYELFRTEEEAYERWRTSLSGRGITAWSWWGPYDEGEKMLRDPSYQSSHTPMVPR